MNGTAWRRCGASCRAVHGLGLLATPACSTRRRVEGALRGALRRRRSDSLCLDMASGQARSQRAAIVGLQPCSAALTLDMRWRHARPSGSSESPSLSAQRGSCDSTALPVRARNARQRRSAERSAQHHATIAAKAAAGDTCAVVVVATVSAVCSQIEEVRDPRESGSQEEDPRGCYLHALSLYPPELCLATLA